MYSSAPTPSPFPEPPRPACPHRQEAGLKTMLEQTVALVFDVALDQIQRPTRGPAQVAVARQVAMYLAHVACGLSLTDAGALFARDRTTVAHACQVVEDKREEPAFDQAIELLECVVKVLAMPKLEAA